jgi:16S rRNA (cytidine1402-2'-O)-methyltransferase
MSKPGHEPTRTYFLNERDVVVRQLAAGLYLVATPIGNLGDISLRALETLAGADTIACEDTRITGKLLERYGIRASLISYHEHNAGAVRPKILERIAGGGSVALVSDAGTPLISDPGYKLVQAAQEAGHLVTAIPGASSVLTALSVSGLPTDRFFFEGFLPAKKTARLERAVALARIPATLVMFESGPRMAASLADLAEVFGERLAAICRELTKLHEEVRRGPVAELASHYAEGGETRGEFVIVIAPPADDEQKVSAEDIDAMLRQTLAKSSLKDAVAVVADATGQPRKDIYRRALQLVKDNGEADD